MQDGRDAKRMETTFNLAMTGSRTSCNIASACHRRSDTFPAMSVFSAQQFLPENDQKAKSVPMTHSRPPRNTHDRDRKRGGEGKSVSVRVDLGGSGIKKKKKQK